MMVWQRYSLNGSSSSSSRSRSLRRGSRRSSDRLQQHRGPSSGRRSTNSWAGRRAAEAQDTLPHAVDLGALFLALQAFPVGGRASRSGSGLHRTVLGIGEGEVGDQVLDHRHVRQRVDSDGAFTSSIGFRQASVLLRRCSWRRSRRCLPAGATEGQRRVDLVLDLINASGPSAAGVEIDFIGVGAGFLPSSGSAVDLELTGALGAAGA